MPDKNSRMYCRAFLRVLLRVSLTLTLIYSCHASTNHYVVLITMDGFPAYLMSDPQAPIPTIRALAAKGAVAEGMKVSNPSVTWPNHTTLVTGVQPEKHSVFFNGVLVRPGTGEPVHVDPKRDKSDLVQVPAIYDHLHQRGYRTAAINWPCTRNSGTLHHDFPDVPDQITHTTPQLREELIAAGILRDATDRSFTSQSAASRDQIWTAAAVHVIKKHKPNFLLVHMLITDSIHHKYGAQSPAGYTAVALADAQLAAILRALEEAGIAERTTVFVVSDHGFERALKLVQPNVLFRKAGLLEIDSGNRITKARAQIISEGGIAMVYLTDAQNRKRDTEQVRALMETQEGIREIIGPAGFAELGLPDPQTNPQMADLILVAQQGYAFGSIANGDEHVTEVTLASGNQGHHGYIASNPKMNAVFVAAGRGIKRGAKPGVIENTKVAPTIAKLLGQNFPSADSPVLSGILSSEAN